MSVDTLVNATASLSLQYQCCDHCCKPTFFFLPDDPSEEILSRHSRHKLYVVKRGSVGSEGIYTDWDVAKTKVDGISGAVHKALKTADGSPAIWAQYCHRFHMHPTSLAAASARPPPYQPRTPEISLPRPPATASSRSRAHPPVTPTRRGATGSALLRSTATLPR